MSESGQTRKSGDAITTSVLPPTAGIPESGCDVRKVPDSDIPAVCTENSNPDVMMVKAAEDRVRTNDSGLLNRTKNRRILVQRPMRSDGVVVIGIGN